MQGFFTPVAGAMGAIGAFALALIMGDFAS
jgi:hypothetical protein